jgi:hypothetical protein
MAKRKVVAAEAPVTEPLPREEAVPGAMADLSLETIAEALAEAEPLWLDDNWEARCPIPGYDGLVRYPAVMDLPRYKQWRQMADTAADEEREMTLAFIYVGDAPQARPFFFSMLYYRMALAFGTIALTRNGRDVDTIDLSSLPVSLVAWLALTAKYWLESQLTFRVDSR